MVVSRLQVQALGQSLCKFEEAIRRQREHLDHAMEVNRELAQLQLSQKLAAFSVQPSHVVEEA
jgi:acetylornithine/succinyldiaminopimelate/putrescine aminotransferase